MNGYSGIFISGLFVGFDKVDRIYNEKEVTQYVYLVSVGTNAYRITSDKNYSDKIAFGDHVTFSTRVRAYNNSIYYSGDLIDD